MKKLCVSGEFYDVEETLGYQPSSGYYAKAVRWGIGSRIAVSRSPRGPWRFWTPRDVVHLTPPKTIPSRFW